MIATLVLALLLAPPAPPDAHALAASAVEDYTAGRYREALGKFERLLALTGDGAWHYNVARCHHQVGDLEAAEAAYARFLQLPNPPRAVRQKAMSHLADVRTRLAERRRPPPDAVSWRPWILGTAIASGALAITGAALLGVGGSDHARLHAGDRDLTLRQARELADRAERLSIAGGVVMGVAVAAAAASVTLWALEPETSGEVSVGGAAPRWQLGVLPGRVSLHLAY